MKVNSIVFFVLVVLLSSCATSYKRISPNELKYYNTLKKDSLSIMYENSVLDAVGNSRNAKKARKKGVQVVAMKIQNQTNDTVRFEDFVFEAGGYVVKPLKPIDTYNVIRQLPGVYFLGLVNFRYTNDTYNGSSWKVSIGLVNVLYVVPNVIVSSVANYRMKEELMMFDVESCVVPPKESRSVILAYTGINPSKISVKSFNGLAVSFSLDDSRVVYKSNMQEFYFNSDKETFESYIDGVYDILDSDRAFTAVRKEKYSYSNGNTKYIGLRAKHTLANNDGYYYKVGTWRYFHKNGKLKKEVDYDLEERTTGRIKVFDENGKLISVGGREKTQ